MTPADHLHCLARQHHDAGRLTEAETLYLRALAHDPAHHPSLHWLGLIFYATGRMREACAVIGRAIGFAPLNALYYMNLAAALTRAGQVAAGAGISRTAAILAPEEQNTWRNLGVALSTDARMAQPAAAALRRAVLPGSTNADLLQKLGETARLAGRLATAVAAYRSVAALTPQNIHMLYNLGTVLKEAGDPGGAVRVFRQAARLAPDFGPGYYGLGDAAIRSGAHETAKAALQRAITLDPARFDSLCGLARLYEKEERLERSLTCFRRASAITPGYAVGHFNTGIMLERLERLEEAAQAYDRAIACDPSLESAHEKFFIKLNLAIWQDYSRDTARVRQLVAERGGKVLPIPFTYLPTTPAEQLLCARRIAAEAVPPDAAQWRRRFLRPTPEADKPVLTIGYMSGDFRDHAIAYLIAELLEVHDRRRFRILGFDTGPNSRQPIRQRIENAVDGMTVLRDLSAGDAAARIHASGVDILVDLSGHTRHARTDVLALRPAPVQVNYLGYPGTSGADFMDYIIVDPFCVPPDQQKFYTERLVHLPDVYQVNDRRKTAAPPRSRCDYGLPDTALVFCCFNNPAKITPQIFDVWMRLLRQVSDAVLWLLVYTPGVMERLRQEAAARGVDPARLIPAPMIAQADHLARYTVADLFLDTFPYTAHTTGSDALWMGCPLVTRVGDTFPSRVAGSLLRAFGVPELVTGTAEDYEALILDLARNRDRLAAVTATIRANRSTSPVYNTPRFARHLEQAFEAMWTLHRNGQPPHPIRVAPAG